MHQAYATAQGVEGAQPKNVSAVPIPLSPDGPYPPIAEDGSYQSRLEKRFPIDFIEDQRAIWTSPLRIKPRHLFWLVPGAAITGEMIHRDAYAYRRLTPAVNTGAS